MRISIRNDLDFLLILILIWENLDFCSRHRTGMRGASLFSLLLVPTILPVALSACVGGGGSMGTVIKAGDSCNDAFPVPRGTFYAYEGFYPYGFMVVMGHVYRRSTASRLAPRLSDSTPLKASPARS